MCFCNSRYTLLFSVYYTISIRSKTQIQRELLFSRSCFTDINRQLVPFWQKPRATPKSVQETFRKLWIQKKKRKDRISVINFLPISKLFITDNFYSRKTFFFSGNAWFKDYNASINTRESFTMKEKFMRNYQCHLAFRYSFARNFFLHISRRCEGKTWKNEGKIIWFWKSL